MSELAKRSDELKANIANLEAAAEFLPDGKAISYDTGTKGIEFTGNKQMTEQEIIIDDLEKEYGVSCDDVQPETNWCCLQEPCAKAYETELRHEFKRYVKQNKGAN